MMCESAVYTADLTPPISDCSPSAPGNQARHRSVNSADETATVRKTAKSTTNTSQLAGDAQHRAVTADHHRDVALVGLLHRDDLCRAPGHDLSVDADAGVAGEGLSGELDQYPRPPGGPAAGPARGRAEVRHDVALSCR